MPSIPRRVGLVVALACIAASAPAWADDDATAEARRLYGEAKSLMGEKKYREAALAFEAAGRLKANAVALYTAAQAWELAQEPARAADAYALALTTPKLNDSQRQKCEERLAELRKELGTISANGDEGTRVRLDDHMEVAVPGKVHASAGEHTLHIARADGTSDARKLSVEAGKNQDVDVDEKAEPQPNAPKVKKVQLSEPRKVPVEERRSPSSAWKTVGFISIGAGVAGLAGGALLGLSAKDAEDTYKADPTRKTYDHAKGLETRTNVMLIAGGVLTVAGGSLVIWQSTKKERPAAARVELGPGTLYAKGSF
ncbi:MAG: hypothetical protein U0263_07030 [Polyangiaceae bacterium]